MKLGFDANREAINKVTREYLDSCEGVDSYMGIHMDQDDAERMLFLERRGIDRLNGVNPNLWRSSRIGHMFAKEPKRYLLLHYTRKPYNLREKNSYSDTLYFLTGAEIYPPFPDVDHNELVIAGLIKALEAIEQSAPEVDAINQT